MRISDWSSDVCSSDLRTRTPKSSRSAAPDLHATAFPMTGKIDMTNWRGVFPAVTTKLRKDESVDLDATAGSIDRLIGNGVSGVIVLPMLGENASLSIEERDSVILAAQERSEEHTSELQSLMRISYAVFCLKKKLT